MKKEQNEALQHRVHSLENELQRVRRLATERSVVASNRSMEISELRGNLSRVEHAIHSPPKEPVQSTPGLIHPLWNLFGALPTGHDVHSSSPRTSLYVFAGHGVHIPGLLPNDPSSHPEHTALPKVEDSPLK